MPAFAPEDIYELRDLTSLGGSRAHDLYTCVVSQAKAGADKYESVVWAARGTAPSRPITSRESTASSPVRDPTAESLVFFSSRGEGSQVLLFAVAGGEVRLWGHLKHVPKSIEGWSPDGARLLLLLSVTWGEDELDDVATEHRPVVARFLPYKLDGSGPVVGKRIHLAVLNAASGVVQILVGGDVDVREASFSPDGGPVCPRPRSTPASPSRPVCGQRRRIVGTATPRHTGIGGGRYPGHVPGGDHSLSSSGRPSRRVDYNRRCTHWMLTRA
jgi:dipeptidyl aminopeptidase/acylaminoacyl peptidase